MKICNTWKFVFIFLLMAFVALMGMRITADAAPKNQKGTLTVKGNEKIAKVSFILYQVGNMSYTDGTTDGASYTLTSDFTGSGVSLGTLGSANAAQKKQMAKDLASYAAKNKNQIKGHPEKADNSGTVTCMLNGQPYRPAGVYLHSR